MRVNHICRRLSALKGDLDLLAQGVNCSRPKRLRAQAAWAIEFSLRYADAPDGSPTVWKKIVELRDRWDTFDPPDFGKVSGRVWFRWHAVMDGLRDGMKAAGKWTDPTPEQMAEVAERARIRRARAAGTWTIQ